MIGALARYVSSPQGGTFQPMKPNMGLLPPLEESHRSKRDRNAALAQRSLQHLETFIAAEALLDDVVVDRA